MKYYRKITEGCAFALVLLWVYTATDKWFKFDLFRGRLHTFPGIGRMAEPVAWGLPPLEIAMAILLMSNRHRSKGFLGSGLLLIAFTIYLAAMLRTQTHLPCTCGGVIETLSWRQHLLFNLFFIILAAMGLYCRRRQGIAYSSSKRQMYET